MIRAYAKINLGLQIFRKREDGYHDIETILHPVDIYDEISINPSEDIRIACDHPDVPRDLSNLCCRAAELVQQAAHIERGAEIRLKKNIPVGAGLGGGSSDAAAVLNHLPRYWNLKLSSSLLRELAIQLGSDVSFFLHTGTARASGRGEILEYFPLELPYWIVIVHPNIRVSTAWAYESIRSSPSPNRIDLKEVLSENLRKPNVLAEELRNDFEPLVFREHEAIRRVKEALYRDGADFALMSGSGSAVFGLFEDEGRAKKIVNQLRKTYEVFLTVPYFVPKNG